MDASRSCIESQEGTVRIGKSVLPRPAARHLLFSRSPFTSSLIALNDRTVLPTCADISQCPVDVHDLLTSCLLRMTILINGDSPRIRPLPSLRECVISFSLYNNVCNIHSFVRTVRPPTPTITQPSSSSTPKKYYHQAHQPPSDPQTTHVSLLSRTRGSSSQVARDRLLGLGRVQAVRGCMWSCFFVSSWYEKEGEGKATYEGDYIFQSEVREDGGGEGLVRGGREE